MEPIAEYKMKEFIGDKLLGFLVAEILLDGLYITSANKGQLFRQVSDLTCNDYLSNAAKRIGLMPHPNDTAKRRQAFYRPPKDLANAYEVKIYTIYKELGIDATKSFITETLFV